MSSDLNQFREFPRKVSTRHGAPKIYMSTVAFLEMLLTHNGSEIVEKLHLETKTPHEQALELLNRIKEARGDSRDSVENGVASIVHANMALVKSRAPLLLPLIPTNAEVRPLPSMTAVREEEGGLALRKAIYNYMDDHNLTPGALVAAVNKRVPHMPEMTLNDFAEIVSGKRKPEDDHVYAFLEFVITHNRKIAPKDKEKEAQALLRSYHQEPDADPFSTYLTKKMMHMDKPMRELANEVIAHVQALHLKPEEGEITDKTLNRILTGEMIPSPGLALALRKTIGESKEDGADFDKAYIAAKYAGFPRKHEALHNHQ